MGTDNVVFFLHALQASQGDDRGPPFRPADECCRWCPGHSIRYSICVKAVMLCDPCCIVSDKEPLHAL